MKEIINGKCEWKASALRMINKHTGNAEIAELTEWMKRINVITVDGREFSVEESRRSGFAQKDISNYLYMKELVNGKWIRIKTR